MGQPTSFWTPTKLKNKKCCLGYFSDTVLLTSPIMSPGKENQCFPAVMKVQGFSPYFLLQIYMGGISQDVKRPKMWDFYPLFVVFS